jgi:hypothetical protein
MSQDRRSVHAAGAGVDNGRMDTERLGLSIAGGIAALLIVAWLVLAVRFIDARREEEAILFAVAGLALMGGFATGFAGGYFTGKGRASDGLRDAWSRAAPPERLPPQREPPQREPPQREA